MTETGFFQQPTRINRTGLAAVILMHGAAITALALSRMDVPIADPFHPTKTWNVPIDPPPDPVPQPKAEPKADQQREATVPPRQVPIPDQSDNAMDTKIAESGPPFVWTLDPPRRTEEPVIPAAEPVRLAATLDPRSVMQPDYPASEQRSGGEGVVVIRVLIGADGRVKAAEKVRATSDAFYRATERHALRQWRFRPATVDGRPVESWKELTVRFELTGQA